MFCFDVTTRPVRMLITAFVLLTLNAAGADEPVTSGSPDWCDCAALEEPGDTVQLQQAKDAMRINQARCQEALGVDLYQNRKGQGSRMDACACPCLDGEGHAVEGPYGERQGAGRPGQASARELEPDVPEAAVEGREP